MTPGSVALWYWLADYYTLATGVLLGVALVMAGLRQPARRLAVAWAALGGLVALSVAVTIPSWPRTSLIGPPSRVQQPRTSAGGTAPAHPTRPAEFGEDLSSGAGRSTAEVRPAATAVENTRPRGSVAVAGRVRIAGEASSDMSAPAWSRLVGRSFLAGSALMLAWLALGSWQAAALRRSSRPAPERVSAVLARVVGDGRDAPGLRVSGTLRQPVAVGIRRPTIILPGRFVADESQTRLEAVLAHEWAHIRHRDLWLIALLRLLLPVLYAHPAYWWLRRRIRDDQEALADAAATAVAGREDYAEALLSWSLDPPGRPPLAAGGSLALFERPSQIRWRIAMLLDRSFPVETTCPAWWHLAVRAGTALAVLGASLLTLRPAAAGAGTSQEAGPTAEAAAIQPERADEPGAAARLLDPDGKPFAGAKVFLSERWSGFDRRPTVPKLLGTTGPDGAFRIPEPTRSGRDSRRLVVAMADGYGPALADPSAPDGAKVLTLVKDDVPLRGRVLDFEGRPVPGATVQLVRVGWHPGGTLDEWLAKPRAVEAAHLMFSTLRWWDSDDIPSLYPPVVTDAEGRFTLEGIGRERVASLLISGPGLETTTGSVATRRMPTFQVPDPPVDFIAGLTYLGADFDIAIGPDLEAIGTITDKDTGRPMAGVTVRHSALFGDPPRFLSTTTDDAGRYRLTGLPPVDKHGRHLLATTDDAPYVPAIQPLGDGDGAHPITVDFRLKRGVWARGRVVDGTTGKGVFAHLSYFILEDNPHLETYPVYGTLRMSMPYTTDDDGSFKLAVMPGPGIIGARAGEEHYRLGGGLDKIAGLKPAGPLGMIAVQPRPLIPTNYNTVVAINPKGDEASVPCEITLDRGRTVKGKVLGPDGRPLAGIRIEGLRDYFRSWSSGPTPLGEFVVEGIGPGASRVLLFYHEGKKLAGTYTIRPDESGPITVTLQPSGAVTGRLVDAGGRPLAGAQMRSIVRFGDNTHAFGSLPTTIRTGPDGRFRAEGLVPGLEYSFQLLRVDLREGTRVTTVAGEFAGARDIIVASGETKDLGDVTAGPDR